MIHQQHFKGQFKGEVNGKYPGEIKIIDREAERN